MWAITTYYNPVRYDRRLSNYKIFRENLASPLVSIELSFDGKFDLTEGDADILIQVCGGALVWQKERLLNLALKAVPADVQHIAWLDCDVILKRNDWALEARKHLQDQNVVQLFSEAVFIDSEPRRRHYLRWAAPFNKSVAGRVGYIPGTIFHLKHGEVENRGYVDRQKGLASFDFDPDIDLRIGQNGAWDWARPRPDLESFIRKYFISRAEDG